MSESILCPRCNNSIEISTALTAQLRERMRIEFDAEVNRKEAVLVSREEGVKDREYQVAEAKRTLEADLQQRLEQEKEKLRKEAKSQAKEAVNIELQHLQTQLTDAKRELSDAQRTELQLRKDRCDLEEKKQALELTVVRAIDEERSKIREEAQRQADEEHRLKAADNDQLITDLRRQLGDIKERELKVNESKRVLEADLQQRLELEKEKIGKEAKSQAKEAVNIELQHLQTQLTDAKKELSDAQRTELQLRKDRCELEEKKQALELTVARAIDEERGKIREEVQRQAEEEHRLKAADSDKLVDDLRRQIGDLKRKAEQGSLQIQGEVMEVELENLLRDYFPHDDIEPIPTSKNGGDVLQHVIDNHGQRCGAILWEAKRTKSFQDGWLGKLREDLRAARGQVAVIVSTELPKGVTTFACIDGVWVTSRACLPGLATALRQGILEVGRTHRHLENKQTKVELLHQYLSSNDFRQRVEGIIEAFVTLKEDLESEKRSMRRMWNKREKQLDRAMSNTTAMYGDLGGILGTKLPIIPQLELDSIAPETKARSDALAASLN